MSELEAVGVGGAGVRLQRFEDGSTFRDVPGLFKLAFIFDPWGTRIELVNVPDYLGFHQIHLSSADPAATLAWYRNVFGGEPALLRGRLEGLLFDGIWLFVSRHAAQHLGLRTRVARHDARLCGSDEPQQRLADRTRSAQRTYSNRGSQCRLGFHCIFLFESLWCDDCKTIWATVRRISSPISASHAEIIWPTRRNRR